MATQSHKEKRPGWFSWDLDQVMEWVARFQEQCHRYQGDAKPTTALDWAVRGCMAVGLVGLVKAIGMQSMAGVVLCLLVSLAAFGLVIVVRSRKVGR